MDGTFSYDNVVMCKLEKEDHHVLKDPKVLPCGNTACLECIEKNVDINSNFLCKFNDCNEIHTILNAEKLPVNVLAENAIRDNRRTITEYLINKLQRSMNELRGAFDEKKIGNIFEFNETKIVARIELLKLELDKLKEDLLKIMRAYRKEFIESFETSFELREQNYYKFIEKVQNSLRMVNVSEDSLKKNMYMCQGYVSELKRYSSDKLKEILFKPSDYVPNIDIVGEIMGCKISNILTNKLRILNFKLESCNGLCCLENDQLLMTSFDENKLLIADKIFDVNTRIIKEVSQIKFFTFNGPFGITLDKAGNIFICDSMNDRVLVTDTDFARIRTVIGKTGAGPGEFDGPCDVCFFDNSLYVLDTGNKRIQEMSITGEFRRDIRLYKRGVEQFDHTFKREALSNPVRVDIIPGIIAVNDNFFELYIYNFQGRIMQLVQNTRDMCFLDTYLFTCSPEGILQCYEKKSEDNGKLYFNQLYKRYIEILKTPLSFMKYFNGHLMFSLTGNKRNLVVL